MPSPWPSPPPSPEPSVSFKEWKQPMRYYRCQPCNRELRSTALFRRHIQRTHQLTLTQYRQLHDEPLVVTETFHCMICHDEMKKSVRIVGHHLRVRHPGVSIRDYFHACFVPLSVQVARLGPVADEKENFAGSSNNVVGLGDRVPCAAEVAGVYSVHRRKDDDDNKTGSRPAPDRAQAPVGEGVKTPNGIRPQKRPRGVLSANTGKKAKKMTSWQQSDNDRNPERLGAMELNSGKEEQRSGHISAKSPPPKTNCDDVRVSNNYQEANGNELSTTMMPPPPPPPPLPEKNWRQMPWLNRCRYQCHACAGVLTSYCDLQIHAAKAHRVHVKELSYERTVTAMHCCRECRRLVINDSERVRLHLYNRHGVSLQSYDAEYGCRILAEEGDPVVEEEVRGLATDEIKVLSGKERTMEGLSGKVCVEERNGNKVLSEDEHVKSYGYRVPFEDTDMWL